ncbi:hypothetical protein JCM17960_23020 [Magnetospira thiophila]
MKHFGFKMLAVAATLGMGALLAGSAQAQYWGAPWGGPGYGYGPSGPGYGYRGPAQPPSREASRLTHERQNLMRDHSDQMRQLKLILDGQRHIDRREATKMAREVEAGAGENLWSLYKPGSLTRQSRSLPLIWEKFDDFKAFAENLKVRAGDLADKLAERPSPEEAKTGTAYRPRDPRTMGPPWRPQPPRPVRPTRDIREETFTEETFTEETVEAFGNLIRACTQCHETFRIPQGW